MDRMVALWADAGVINGTVLYFTSFGNSDVGLYVHEGISDEILCFYENIHLEAENIKIEFVKLYKLRKIRNKKIPTSTENKKEDI